ncbi:MAG: hypothetical protein KF726_09135 [Anaerolineae bacterium]|nr:hypothetical protein [Anaerolineae bacterium]
MMRSKRWIAVLLITALILLQGAITSVNAQGGTQGALTKGQPVSAQVAAGQVLRFDYVLTATSQVSIQSVSDTAIVTLSVVRDGSVVAAEANPTSQFTIILNAVLSAGSYVVEVSTVNNTAGVIILIVQNETPVTITPLVAGAPVNSMVNPATTLALYSFTGLAEPAYLYIDSALPDRGINAQLLNTTSGQKIGEITSALLGARFRIPTGTDAYQVEIQHSGSGDVEPFTLCLAPVSASNCEGGGSADNSIPTLQPFATVGGNTATPENAPCTVTPTNGSVNIRQSASTGSIIYGVLRANDVAAVTGISPDGAFYNILYNSINGWVAVSVVTSSGNCANVPQVSPPPVIAPSPTPTFTPQPSPTPSGPCLITIISPTNVYTIPTAIVDNLFDQIQGGGQLIPTGRLADNSWWKTNYNGSWIQTSTFGGSASVSGNCNNLPIVSP